MHALELLHDLLNPDGRLIDIHPTPQPPVLEVQRGGQRYFAGWLQETDNFIEHIQADEAIEQVLARGLFEIESQGQFLFVVHTAGLDELLAYFAADWQDALIDAHTRARIGELYRSLSAPGQEAPELLLNEWVHIARLRPCTESKTRS